jgi:hypothetical protein
VDLTCLIAKKHFRLCVRVAMRVAVLLGLMWVAIGCSSHSTTLNSGSGGQGGTAGGFTNASLKGRYTYSLNGFYFPNSGYYQRAGVFIADGNGNITGGIDDFVQSAASTNPVTGNYAVASDGTGLLTLNVGTGQVQLAVVMESGSRVDMIEFDSLASGAGVAQSQDSGVLTNPPAGTFVFRFHSDLASTVGNMIFSARQVSGNEDLVRNGTLSSVTITGTVTAPDSNGRGTINLTDSGSISSAYIYYLIDSNTMNLLTLNMIGAPVGALGAGKAELQSSGPFALTSLQGGFVFHSSGDTLVEVEGVNTAGEFTADGKGNIPSGSYDSVVDGVPIADAALTGSYDVASNGRATITLNPAGVSAIPEIAWLVSPSRAFFMVNVVGRAEDGTLDQQKGNPFSASSLSGQYTFYMHGYDAQSPPQIDRAGVASFDGKSTLAFQDYFVNRGGSMSQTKAAGSNYTVSSTGRVATSVPGVTSNMVVYLVSGTSGYLILGDHGSEVSGRIAQQSPP